MNTDGPRRTFGRPVFSGALMAAIVTCAVTPGPVLATTSSVVAAAPMQTALTEPGDSAYAPRLRTYEHAVPPVAADEVQHYGAPLRLLQVEGAGTSREVALQRGLAWTLRLLDADHTLHFMAGDVLEMLHELTVPAPESALARAAGDAIRITAARIAVDPGRYFTPNTQGRWQFIAVIRLLLEHDVDVRPFSPFYEEHFPGPPGAAYEDLFYDIPFDEAVRTAHHRSMGNYLTYSSFLHFLVRDYPASGFELPDDDFHRLLSRLVDLHYMTDGLTDADVTEQDYFATHLAMMLTNWGEESLLQSAVTRRLVPRLSAYLDDRYDRVRLGSTDFVLFAEFVEALRLLGLPADDRVARGEAELLARQHEDGSWGAEIEATILENPYTALHPTWAAMAALRHER